MDYVKWGLLILGIILAVGWKLYYELHSWEPTLTHLEDMQDE